MASKNRWGATGITSGPLTMGYRVNNSRTGNAARGLIYPKGAFVLHMLRMMMWNSQSQDADADFKAMMQDFVKTYTNRPTSTEDFKAMVEKHITPAMDLDRNHKMDWFFNQFVYGMEMPSYKFEQSISQGQNGPVLNFKITQSNVDQNFKMAVPLYLEMANGGIVRLGSATLLGNSTVQQSVPLPLKEMPKRGDDQLHARRDGVPRLAYRRNI